LKKQVLDPIRSKADDEKPANWDVILEAEASADAAIQAAKTVPNTTEAEDADKLASRATEAMTRLQNLIEESAKMKQTMQVERAKHTRELELMREKKTGDTALKQPLFKARADYLTERTNRLKAPRGVPRETIDQLRYLSDARNTLTALQMLRNGHRQGDAKYWEDNKATYGLLRDELQRLEVMPIAATVPDAKNAVTGVLRAFTPHPGSTDAHFDDPAALDSAVQRAAATIDVSRGTLEAPPAP
jgi:hypothetical protein